LRVPAFPRHETCCLQTCSAPRSILTRTQALRQAQCSSAPLTFNVVTLLLDSSALHSACAPSTPISLSAAALHQRLSHVMDGDTHHECSQWSQCGWIRVACPAPVHPHRRSCCLENHVGVQHRFRTTQCKTLQRQNAGTYGRGLASSPWRSSRAP
jgi:hypothetical protein